MSQLFKTISERRGDIVTAVFEHLTISFFALLIASVIAIFLAIVLSHHKRTAGIVLQITSILQTIPSLALLGLLIPLVGIGTIPALIALVIYALLPIFQNTFVGLSQIDPSLSEAADAFGLSRLQKLIKLEIPLALPVIVSGVRTALVLIIGTATLAALIGAGGLGTFILLGIDRNDTNLIIIGAVLSALLAIIFSALIGFMQKKRPIVAVISLLSLTVVLGGISLAQSDIFKPKVKENIVIAGKLGSEPEILINMYKDLIEAQDKNVTVTLKPNFGKTTFLFNALKSDKIDIYPEFTGTVLESIVKVPENEKGKVFSSEATYQKGKKLLKSQFDMDFLKPMSYQNTYAVAVKKSFAKANHLTTISDLKAIQDKVKAGFTLEFIDRGDGYKGIQSKYGENFASVSSMEPALRYQAINSGAVNVIDAYSTDSEIKRYDLVVLKDDKQLFPPYQGAPILKADFAKAHPKIVKALNKLAGKISESDMSEMNYDVAVKKVSAEKVAQDYLEKHGLLEK
ncbi:ABC transporter permease/substrate-binding protein [Lactococcus insecticola]|uniref:Glycine/betaine ABC transporter permease n=1 Tax=Pseudolactococcus insecticola TaxID=2709158 RepID=A0A6A0B582_9LACT|nr:ABC transporter permease/substrate-binding protein [Lactococcus insecticola]GFH40382.1 glycine/betaine ABC transporter permease [Lactococcus insecticola]